MERNISCLKCSKNITVKACSNRIGRSKFCSKVCSGLFIPFWDSANWEQKVSRLSEYFEKYVIRDENCWGWKGKRKLDGRGALNFEKKSIQAHRASWIIHFGKIPDKKLVCHHCDNPICTNPKHLFLGTSSENIVDAIKKNRKSTAKLRMVDVIEIKKMLKNNIPGNIIANKFNVDPMTISDIKLNKTWRHVLGE